jgi:uncharacterized sulfatase
MTQPNFILIVTDSQSSGMVGAYSGQSLATDNIDRLAATGIRFSRAYCPAPICTPCRAALFSGIYSHTSGSWTNNLALGYNIVTMGRRFRDLDYTAALIGKWHLDGHDYFGTGRCAEGWDPRYWYEGANYLAELDEREIALWRGGLKTVEDLRREGITREFTWAHRISNRGIDFLRNGREGKPFLLVLSYDEPHHPFTCPPEYAEAFRDFEYDLGPSAFDDLADKPSIQREWAAAMDHPAVGGKVRSPLLFGCNAFVDDEIGRVIDTLDELQLENTWVVYISDHGEMMGAHGLSLKGCAGYEEITHVPFIVRPPQGLRVPRVDSTLVNLVDILPTFLDLAGVEPPSILHGKSLKDLCLNRTQNEDRAVFTEFNRYEIEHDSFGGFKPMRMIVRGQFKLVIHLLCTDELYDLKNDPGELHNLINDPETATVRDALHRELLDWMEAKRDPFRGSEWERRPWQRNPVGGWMGYFRPRPEDGYAPVVRDYDTGMPARGVKAEQKTTL